MTATTLRFPFSVAIVNEGAYRLAIYNPKIDDTLYAGGGNVADITAYEGDYGYDLQFTVTDVDGDAVNLTGGTVKFKMAKPTGSSLDVEGTCVLTDPTNGRCVYTTQSADFATAGVLIIEVRYYIVVVSQSFN
jgi:hypothetical protein